MIDPTDSSRASQQNIDLKGVRLYQEEGTRHRNANSLMTGLQNTAQSTHLPQGEGTTRSAQLGGQAGSYTNRSSHKRSQSNNNGIASPSKSSNYSAISHYVRLLY